MAFEPIQRRLRDNKLIIRQADDSASLSHSQIGLVRLTLSLELDFDESHKSLVIQASWVVNASPDRK